MSNHLDNEAALTGGRYFDMDPVSLRELRPGNPRRPLSWRWQLANHSHEDNWPRLAKYADVHVAKARRLQSILRRCRTDDEWERLWDCEDPYPDILEAAILWLTGEHLTAELEARVLADEDCASIGRKIGTTPEVVLQYEMLFFDARSRLDMPSYITTVAIGGTFHAGMTSDDLPTLWKALAYASRSGHVVDHVVYGRVGSQDPSVIEQVQDFMRTDFLQSLAIGATTAINSISLEDPKAKLRMVKTCLREEARKARSRSTDPEIDIMPNVDAFFSELESIWFRAQTPIIEDFPT